MEKERIAFSLVVPVADSENSLKVIEVRGGTVKVSHDKDVVGTDCGESSRGRRIVKDNWDVALPVNLDEGGSREAHTACSREGTGSVSDELVVEDDEPVRIVQVPVGEGRVRVHEVDVGRSSAIALFIQDDHETHVDDVSLRVVEIEVVHELDGSEGDRSPNPSRGTITDRNLVDGGESPRDSTWEGREVEGDVRVLRLDTRGLETTVGAARARKATKLGTATDHGRRPSCRRQKSRGGPTLGGSRGVEEGPSSRGPEGGPDRGPVGGGRKHLNTKRFLRNEFIQRDPSRFHPAGSRGKEHRSILRSRRRQARGHPPLPPRQSESEARSTRGGGPRGTHPGVGPFLGGE